MPGPSLFSSVDVSSTAPALAPLAGEHSESEQNRLLRSLLAAQDRQNELLEELVAHLGGVQRQRNQELTNWRTANPRLAQECRAAAEVLSRVQTEFLRTMVAEVNEQADALTDGDFMLGEFVDRFGPRLAHLNGMVQMLAQLSNLST